MSDLLTAIQIACLVLLAIGEPAYAVLRLKWRAEAEAYMLRNERLKSSRLEREVQLLQEACTEVQCRGVDALASASDRAQHRSDAGKPGAQQPIT